MILVLAGTRPLSISQIAQAPVAESRQRMPRAMVPSNPPVNIGRYVLGPRTMPVPAGFGVRPCISHTAVALVDVLRHM